jgi:hypothetical protein
MSLGTTRHTAGRREIRSWRLLAILVLVTASMLLAVPGAATAHVKAKYRAEYTGRLTSFQKTFGSFAVAYDAAKDDANIRAETMAPWVGDPASHEQLVAWEDDALTIYNRLKAQPDKWQHRIALQIDAWSAKASRYFASKTDQRKFRQQAQSLKRDFGWLMMGHTAVYESFQALGMDPPALELSAQRIADGDAAAATAHEGCDRHVAALKQLR